MFALAAPVVSVVGGLLLLAMSSMFTVGTAGSHDADDAAVPPHPIES
jgi:hypothetical protein